MNNQSWLIVVPIGILCIMVTLFSFHSIVESMYFMRLARYENFSSRAAASIGLTLLSTLFVYTVAGWQLHKYKLVHRRNLWVVLPIGAFFGILAVVGYRQIQRDAKEIDLLYAAEHGEISMVNALLNQGTIIEARNLVGMTPLMRAAEYGQMETVKALLARGANIEARDMSGFTAVALAADQGQSETLDFLLQQGADPNAEDKEGRTPLIWAAAFANHRTVETLLRHGADVNAQSKLGKTALMMAAGDREDLGSRGNALSVRALMAVGANTELKDHNGNTARMTSQKHGREELAAMLAPGADWKRLPPGVDAADEAKSTANWP